MNRPDGPMTWEEFCREFPDEGGMPVDLPDGRRIHIDFDEHMRRLYEADERHRQDLEKIRKETFGL